MIAFMRPVALLLLCLCSCAASGPPPGAPPPPPPPCAEMRAQRELDEAYRYVNEHGFVPCSQVMPPERLQCSQGVSPEYRGCPEDRCTDPCADCRRTYPLAVQPYVECQPRGWAPGECYVPEDAAPSTGDWPPM